MIISIDFAGFLVLRRHVKEVRYFSSLPCETLTGFASLIEVTVWAQCISQMLWARDSGFLDQENRIP